MPRVQPATLVIVNPASRGGATRKRFPRLHAELERAIGPFELAWTEGRRHAERLAAEGASRFERVIAAGGDGTLSEVVCGLLSAGAPAKPTLGLLPMGTGGDMARSLGIPRDPAAAIAVLGRGATRPLDAGRIAYTGLDGAPREGWFVNEAGGGFSGAIVHRVEQGGKRLGPSGDFLLATLGAIVRNEPMAARVRVDGEPFHEGPCVLVSAANGAWFGGGMHVAPGALLDDGRLDVTVIDGLTRREMFRKLPRLYRGTHGTVPGVKVTRARVVEAEPLAGPVPMELDGEPIGRLPFRAEVAPGALRVVGGTP